MGGAAEVEQCQERKDGVQCELEPAHDVLHLARLEDPDEPLRWATEPSQEEMARGHLWQLSVTCRGVSQVTGDPTYHQANDDYLVNRVQVRAHSLPAAMRAAAEVPLWQWRTEDVDSEIEFLRSLADVENMHAQQWKERALKAEAKVKSD